ncbi:MAG: DUF4974 domain-containing protein [Carboxylicivirga sp.]|jgi:ferric-dicitrate binding protein FerR (iron transport regulator)|nr:DUF4974 domain-containing protein [Carboxylicivirga sp.]
MADKTNNEALINLINKDINGEELSAEERTVLNNWLINSENEALFKKLRDKEHLLHKRLEYDEYDVDKAWQKMNQRISPRINYRLWLGYAAAIILPIIMFYAVFRSSIIEPEVSPVAENNIQPGEQKAILWLSSGEQIELGAADTSIIRTAGGVAIQLDSMGANYKKLEGEQKEEKFNLIQTSKGMEYNLTLADGTRVWLNSESSLRYPESFTADARHVYASGEVYLQVASNKEKPFYVHFNERRIEVLGTEFNVRSYASEKVDEVTLVEGSISLNVGANKLLMEPDKQVLIDQTNTLQLLDVDASMVAAWKDGRFVYKDVPLDRIVSDLARWYNVEVFYQNHSMKNERFSLSTNRQENIQQILEALELTETVKFKINGKNIVIQSVN